MTDVEDGYCRSVLPAAQVSTNQHHALQGATFPGLPTFGVHPVKSGLGNNIWLSHANLKYAAPTYDDLVVSCRIDKGQYEMFQRRFWQGQRVVAHVDLEFLSNGKQTMKGSTTTYFSQKIHYEEWLARMDGGEPGSPCKSGRREGWLASMGAREKSGERASSLVRIGVGFQPIRRAVRLRRCPAPSTAAWRRAGF